MPGNHQKLSYHISDVVIRAESEFEEACQRSHFYRLEFSHKMPTVIHPLSCKSRQCPQCGKYWANRVRSLLNQEQELETALGITRDVLALNLTTAYNPGYKKFWRAREYFFEYLRDYSPQLYVPPGKVKRIWVSKKRRDLKIPISEARRPFAKIQYFCSMESNEKQTQPHAHFLLIGAKFIDYKVIRDCWRRAQERAGFKLIAWNLRIEKPEKGMAAYMSKYISKITGQNKDYEIPSREMWKGRYISYSREFFLDRTALLLARRNLQALVKRMENGETGRNFYLLMEGVPFSEFIHLAKETCESLSTAINAPWEPSTDRARAQVFKPELWQEYPPDLNPPKWQNIGPPGRADPPPEYSDLPIMTVLACPLPARVTICTPATDRASHFAESLGPCFIRSSNPAS